MSRINKQRLKKTGRRSATKNKFMSKKMLWTLIIGGLMIASVFGIMFSSYNSSQEELSYGEYQFQRTQGGWVVEINGQMHEFSYFPADLEEFELNKDVVSKMAGLKVVYITFNPNSDIIREFELMRFKMAQDFSDMFNIYAMPGITDENEAYDQQLIDCDNATAEIPVILLVEANETNAHISGVSENCIVLESNKYSTASLKDRLIYSMLGIMD